jgi:hypothetical protein
VHVSVKQVHRKPHVLLGALVAFLIVTAVAPGATAPVRVKGTARNEVGPAASSDWFVWSKSRERRASPFDLFAQHLTDPAFKVNPKGTQAYAGGIDGTKLVYQLLRGRIAIRSDLRLFDLATRKKLTLPGGINTKGWECCATISGNWLLFTRGHSFSRDRQLLLLRNLVTGEQRVLDQLRNKNGVIAAGQLNGSFAVWSRCNPYPRCQVFRYDLGSATTTGFPVPTGKVPYSASVNQYGTTYYFQSNKGCGKSPQMLKQPLDGPPQVIATIPEGRDSDVSYAFSPTPHPPLRTIATHIYYDLTVCRTHVWDIYRVDDTDSLPPPSSPPPSIGPR